MTVSREAVIQNLHLLVGYNVIQQS